MNDSKDLKEKKNDVNENVNSSEVEVKVVLASADNKGGEEGNTTPKVFSIYGKVIAVSYEGKKEKTVTVRMLDDNESIDIPIDAIGFAVNLNWILKLEVEEKGGNRTIKSVKIHSKGEESASNKESESPSEEDDEVEEAEVNKDPIEDDMELAYLNQDFVLETMSIPTDSHNEFRMVVYIIQFAKRNGITYEFDDYGNIYLTKGTLEEGEYYPCVTSHLDTVQHKQEPYIRAGVSLDLKCERTKEGEHKLSVDTKGQSSIGIGADDKSGVCICLSMFEHFEKLKACFFLCEEVGCLGSSKLDKDWFKNVGYCIGYDSPDLFRAAWSCSGVKLFSYEFYQKWMKPVCDEWGLKDCFYSEPITDVMEIRKQTNVMCMNFGNGGYNAHMESEYCIIEHMDHACGMGVALIDHIGNTRHEMKHVSSYSVNKGTYRINSNGLYIRTDVDDTKQLESLGDNKRFGGRTTNYSYQANNNTHTSATKSEQLNFEMVEYIVNRYEGHILAIKEELVGAIKAVCEKSNIDFSLFESEIAEKFNNNIKF